MTHHHTLQVPPSEAMMMEHELRPRPPPLPPTPGGPEGSSGGGSDAALRMLECIIQLAQVGGWE